MDKSIVVCRGCKSEKIKYALNINGKEFVICKLCTLLQRKDDIPYNITFDFSIGILSVDYYPYFLKTQFPKEDICLYFSLKSIEVILEQAGYKVVDTQTTDEGKLNVQFDKLDNVDKLRLYEMMRKLGSQFTYLLYSMRKK
jgi:hypothetical protein